MGLHQHGEPLPLVARVRCWRMSNFRLGWVAPPKLGKMLPQTAPGAPKSGETGPVSDGNFVPTNLAAISETLRVCASAVELYCDECQIARPSWTCLLAAGREPAPGPVI